MPLFFLAVAGIAAACLCSCARMPEQIAPAEVPTAQYDSMSCSQLQKEAVTLTAYANPLYAQQTANSQNDLAMTTIGVAVFWPAMILNNGDGTTTSQVAIVRGHMLAIDRARTAKKCDFPFYPM